MFRKLGFYGKCCKKLRNIYIIIIHLIYTNISAMIVWLEVKKKKDSDGHRTVGTDQKQLP